MLTVHHLGISQSERVIWLCEELGLDYVLKKYKRDPKNQMAPAEYKALHPMGIAPVITDNGVLLAESNAIIEYITNVYKGSRLIVNKDAGNYSEYLFWLHFANGSLLPSSVFEMLDIDSDVAAKSSVISGFCDRAQRAYDLIEARLGEAKYLAGDNFSLADIMTVFCLTTLPAFTGRSLDNSPNTHRYLELIESRPAYQAALKKR